MAKLRTRDGLAELQSAVWLLHGTIDPLKTLFAGTPVFAQQSFSVRARGGARGAPIEACFHFYADSLSERTLAFTWSHDDDTPLPSMSGTLAARRIGPLVILVVHAHYACGLDVPERLFFEAVGRRLAEKTFSALQRALIHLLQHLPSRSMYEV
jgi:hypothetical protein